MQTILLVLLLTFAAGCRTTDPNKTAIQSEFGPEGIPISWGSLNPMPNNPISAEDKAANAAAKRLNETARLKDLLIGLPPNAMVVDGMVSIPVNWGDGKTKETFAWKDWPVAETDVPLTLSLAQVKTATLDARLLIVEPSVLMIQNVLGDAPATIWAELSDDQQQRSKIALIKDETRQVYRAVITIDMLAAGISASPEYPAFVTQGAPWMNLLANNWGWPKVKVRFSLEDQITDNRYWPVLFRFPSQPRELAQASLATGSDKFKDTDRAISLPPYTQKTENTAADMLRKWRGETTNNNIGFHTAGDVDTYTLDRNSGNNQVLYKCFAPQPETRDHQWRVPSEGKWDAPNFAETLVNGFEDTGIFVGWGAKSPYSFSEPTPYDAKDIVTFRILRPDETYTTSKSHFHWYAVDATRKVCAIIWQHVACDLVSDRDLKCKV